MRGNFLRVLIDSVVKSEASRLGEFLEGRIRHLQILTILSSGMGSSNCSILVKSTYVSSFLLISSEFDIRSFKPSNSFWLLFLAIMFDSGATKEFLLLVGELTISISSWPKNLFSLT